MAKTVCVASNTASPAHSEAIQNQLYETGRSAISMRRNRTLRNACPRNDAANQRLAAASSLVPRSPRRHTHAMNTKIIAIGTLTLLCSFARGESSDSAIRSPVYTEDGQLTFPADYREWVYLSSGFDMAYNPMAMSHHMFDNVFVE